MERTSYAHFLEVHTWVAVIVPCDIENDESGKRYTLAFLSKYNF